MCFSMILYETQTGRIASRVGALAFRIAIVAVLPVSELGCGPSRAARELAALVTVAADAEFRESSIEARLTFFNRGASAAKNPEISCHVELDFFGDSGHILWKGREIRLTRKVLTVVPADGYVEESITFNGMPTLSRIGARLACSVTRVQLA